MASGSWTAFSNMTYNIPLRMASIPTTDALTIISTLSTAVLLIYIIYMRFLHPLSKYPGPLLASLTNTFKAYYVYHAVLHEKLLELHMQYGPVVRVGPNHLHLWDAEAIAPIYKGGRSMGKTEFYDAFTAFNPNLFGGTNEDVRLPFSMVFMMLIYPFFTRSTPSVADSCLMDSHKFLSRSLSR